nr:hypothetical protein [uncultured Lacinutrix sp.]
MIEHKPYIFDLELSKAKIISWTNFNTGKLTPKLSIPLTGFDYKIYVLTADKKGTLYWNN